MVYLVPGRNIFVWKGSQTFSAEQKLVRFVWFQGYFSIIIEYNLSLSFGKTKDYIADHFSADYDCTVLAQY